jgi:fatty-acyl-CoA synthase
LRAAVAATARGDQIGGPKCPGTIAFEDVAKWAARGTASSAELARTLQFDDAVNIQFTSGTTGSLRA